MGWSRGCWAPHRGVALGAQALLVRGKVERQGEVINIKAERIEPMPLTVPTKSRDFRCAAQQRPVDKSRHHPPVLLIGL